MKFVSLTFGLGYLQFMIDQVCGSIDAPIRAYKTNEIVQTDERWECSRCGNSNGEWTSICGRCGRSR